MVFGLFKKKARTPLLDRCKGINSRHIAAIVDSAPSDNKRAKVLFLFVAMAAADFIKSTTNTEGGPLIAKADLDDVTAEVLIWVGFILGRLAGGDCEPGAMDRFGYLTNHELAMLTLAFIEGDMGIDFEPRAAFARRRYGEALKAREDLAAAFATHLNALESRKEPPADFMQQNRLLLVVATFYATMPLGIYRNFQKIFKEHPDKFSFVAD